ncbi:MAG: phosphoglycerate mutase [Xanthomonadales bacterium]|nr:phosphoglycerate mutase [Xanthomonadales bacterium]
MAPASPKRDLVMLAPARPGDGVLARDLAAVLRRADRLPALAGPIEAQVGDLFGATGSPWPLAALSRQHDAGDAAGHDWLRADPAHFRLEPGSVRLLAVGELGLDADDAAALVRALAPLFGDAGFELSAPLPQRWYLRPFRAGGRAEFPSLPPPEAALGGDLFGLWPEDDAGRHWRALLGQAQIELAAHPANARRLSRGQPAVNGLWFFGPGALPAAPPSVPAMLVSEDPVLLALAGLGGDGAAAAAELHDLRGRADADARLSALLAAVSAGEVGRMDWRAPDARWLWKPGHRWRFWRR